VSFDDFRERLKKIAWYRHRQHWIAITSHKTDKSGKKKAIDVIEPGVGKVRVVEGAAQNTKAVVAAVRNKILSAGWGDLCSNVNEAL
jgi:hypothetical protein